MSKRLLQHRAAKLLHVGAALKSACPRAALGLKARRASVFSCLLHAGGQPMLRLWLCMLRIGFLLSDGSFACTLLGLIFW
jgi:hypothetical protein